MKINNKMGKFAYLWEHIFYIAIIYIWHNNLLFECLSGRTYKESKALLWLLIIAIGGICYLFTHKRCRTGFNALINVLLPFGVYSFLVLFGMFKVISLISISLIIVLSLLLAYAIFGQRTKCKPERSGILKKRVVRWIVGSRTIATVVLSVVIGTMTASVIFNGNMLLAKTEAVVSAEQESEWYVSKKTDELKKLKEEQWKELSMQEKLDILQVVVNIQARYLGIGHELNVGTRPLEENVLGQYTYKTHTISIDTEYLQNGNMKDIVKTIAHESRHAYQDRTIEAMSYVPDEYHSLFMFYDVCLFKNGQGKYGDDTDEGYYFNELEIDARRYAEESTERFFEELDRCLSEEKNA